MEEIKISSKLFASDPPVLIFEDYIPGKSYTIRFKLTNISCLVNAFQLSPLSQELNDCGFNFTYSHSGRMSAGMTSEAVMTFSPPSGFNQDIESFIHGTAELGGHFSIPFECRKQLCIPKVLGFNSRDIDLSFGEIVSGSVATKSITLRNFGVLPTTFSIIRTNANSGFQSNIDGGELHKNQTVKIDFTFSPGADGDEYSETLSVDFNDDEIQPYNIHCTGKSFRPPLKVEKKELAFGICDFSRNYGKDLILTNESSQSITFHVTCASPDIPINVINGSLVCKLPQKAGTLNILTKSAVMQRSSNFPIRIQLKPLENTSKELHPFTVPLKINYAMSGVACCVDFLVSGSITNASLSFDFEKNFMIDCSIYEQLSLPLTITNHSHLEQTCKLSLSSSAFTLENDGVDVSECVLAPLKNGIYQLVFKPNQKQKYPLEMIFESQRGKKYKFSGLGNGFIPQVRFNKNVLEFPDTSLGGRSDMKVSLLHEEPPTETPNYHPWVPKKSKCGSGNHGNISYQFLEPRIEFSASKKQPLLFSYTNTDPCPVKVVPSSGYFHRSGKDTINVIVSPELSLEKVKSAVQERKNRIETDRQNAIAEAEELTRLDKERYDGELAAATAAAPKKKGAKTAAILPDIDPARNFEPIFKEEPPLDYFDMFQDCTAKVWVPCRITSEKTQAIKDQEFIYGSKQRDQPDEKVEELTQLLLNVRITAPEFVFVEWPGSEPQTDEITHLLNGTVNFKTVPVGQELVLGARIRNLTSRPIKPSATMLNPQGPFYYAKALRVIEEKGEHVLKFSFEPRFVGKYQSIIQVASNGTLATVRLCGEAVIPRIELKSTHEEETATGVDAFTFPELLIGDESQKFVSVWNPCHFPITVKSTAASCSMRETESCYSEEEEIKQFEITPSSVEIQPQQEQVLTIKFTPTAENPRVTDTITLSYWGMEASSNIRVSAKSWEFGAILSGFDKLVPEHSVGDVIERINSEQPEKQFQVRDCRLVECVCKWQQVEKDDKVLYTLEPKTFEVLNLKPEVLKMENVGKNAKSLAAAYQIEKISRDQDPPPSYALELDSMSGNVDQGSRKLVGVKLCALNTGLNDSAAPKKSKKPQPDQIVYTEEKLELVSYFRVTFKGGYRSTEPKGISQDPQDWLLKVSVVE